MQLAHAYKPDITDEKLLKKKYRPLCKRLLLAIHYGMAPSSLARDLEVSVDEAKTLMNAYYSRYSVAKEYIESCKQYCKETGEIRTIFGDKLRADKKKYNTQGINYVLQNSASVLMQFGFHNMDYAIRQLGFWLHPKSVIHDSNQNEIWVKDLPYIARCYKKFYREHLYKIYGVDFKYDLELLRTFRDHTVFEMDYDNSIMELSGPEDDINYYVKYLSTAWDLELIEEGEHTPASNDLYLDYSKGLDTKRGHQYCMHPMVKRNCDMVDGRKYHINHDWKSDPMMQKIEEMPYNACSMIDRFVGKWQEK